MYTFDLVPKKLVDRGQPRAREPLAHILQAKAFCERNSADI
jgi:hypothetical protein